MFKQSGIIYEALKDILTEHYSNEIYSEALKGLGLIIGTFFFKEIKGRIKDKISH